MYKCWGLSNACVLQQTLLAVDVAQGFLLYEEAIPDSKQEVQALASIVSTLYTCRLADEEVRMALIHKASGYCSKLLRRADQCMAVLSVSQLYWQPADGEQADEDKGASEAEAVLNGSAGVRDAAAVLSCLKRALRIAHALQQQIIQTGRGEPEGPGLLFLQILNRYLYYYEHGIETIALSAVQVGFWLIESGCSLLGSRRVEISLLSWSNLTYRRTCLI